MKLSEPYSGNSSFDQELVIAGVSAQALAKEFGTPLFVIDEADFFDRASAWKSALDHHFGATAGTVYYAGKSFLNKEIARWIHTIGIGLDVCSGGELAVATSVGFPMDRVELHGNNKSEVEIRAAITAGVGIIVMDSFHEIERVARIAAELQKIQRVYLRLTPGVEAHTHEFISTAHEDQKFGFSIASGAAWRAIEKSLEHSSLSLVGLHSHIGSQILINEGFEIAATRLIELLAKYRDHFDRQLPELDLGGGYGIAYLPGDSSLVASDVLGAIAAVVKSECEKHGLTVPKISIEPGRHIVGPTTTTLYEVGTTKSVELDGGDSRRYISIDGGMSDNIRPSLYGAKYTALIANRLSSADLVSSRIVGKHCETGDIVIREIDLPEDVAPGDLLAVPATGAYGRSMASNYNHMPRPAVVAVREGKARIITRRESINDLLALDI
jgi:diaminopimelate decarboxylase